MIFTWIIFYVCVCIYACIFAQNFAKNLFGSEVLSDPVCLTKVG